MRHLGLFGLLLLSSTSGVAAKSNSAAKVALPPGCTDTINGGVRNCCPTTGLCQDSSCTVFGYDNSARANCAVTKGKTNCPNSYCAWQVANCTTVDESGNHCYGKVRCRNGGTLCYGYDLPCLEDGNSQNYKICGNSCQGDTDCPPSSICRKTGGQKTTCEVTSFVGWNLNVNLMQNPLTPATAVQFLRSRYPDLQYAKLFDYNVDMINALVNGGVTNIVVAVPNVELSTVAGSVTAAERIANVIKPFTTAGLRMTVAVGNEPTLAAYNGRYTGFVLDAVRNMRRALRNTDQDSVRLTVPFDASILSVSYPPTSGDFRSDLKSLISDVSTILKNEGSSFLINAYPFFAYEANPVDIKLEYALLQTSHTVDGVTYPNMLAAQVAAVRAALQKLDNSFTAANLPIVLGEVGWPTAGSPAATIQNAQTFVRNAINSGISMYIFEAFDEKKKIDGSGSSGNNNAVEPNWGFMYEDGTPKYSLDGRVTTSSWQCDTKFPPAGGDFVGIPCPSKKLDDMLNSGTCTQDPDCGIITCPSMTQAGVLSACQQSFM